MAEGVGLSDAAMPRRRPSCATLRVDSSRAARTRRRRRVPVRLAAAHPQRRRAGAAAGTRVCGAMRGATGARTTVTIGGAARALTVRRACGARLQRRPTYAATRAGPPRRAATGDGRLWCKGPQATCSSLSGRRA
eukprot:497342-Pleurochrysis_carterae.AAC.2